MISKDEIEEKANQFKISPTDVERDYVFGWILNGIYSQSILKDHLILKGGNLYRKAYLHNARFSKDLDFGYQTQIDPEIVIEELNFICESISNTTGIDFDLDRNKIELKKTFNDNQAYEARLYFKNFYGKRGRLTISAKLDIAEMQKIFLPVQQRPLIHPYSDSESCSARLNCVKLEESLADKLKCLLQRKHIADLFDLIYSIFFNTHYDLDRTEIIKVFLQKTIFYRNPNVAKNILLGLPLVKLEKAWVDYIIAPLSSLFDFNTAITKFQSFVNEIFLGNPSQYGELAFFPSGLRNSIIEAGYEQKTIYMTYEGYKREIEPYSLS